MPAIIIIPKLPPGTLNALGTLGSEKRNLIAVAKSSKYIKRYKHAVNAVSKKNALLTFGINKYTSDISVTIVPCTKRI